MRIVTPAFHEESFAKSAFRGPYRKHLMPKQGKHYIPPTVTLVHDAPTFGKAGRLPCPGPLPLVPRIHLSWCGGDPTSFRVDHHSHASHRFKSTRSKPSRWRFRFMLS